MGQPESKPRLIHTKRGALIALCVTGYLAALSFRDLLSPSQHKPHWLVDLPFILPPWAVAAVNLGFYVYLVWISVVFYRMAQGRERVLVGGWITSFFLGQIQNLVSASAAAAIDYVQALAMLVALLAAVDILLRAPGERLPSAR